MSTPGQYRAKATEYGELRHAATTVSEKDEYQRLEQSFTTLADNAQWLADNPHKLHRPGHPIGGGTLTEQEEHVLRCLGAALIMQWNTLPTKLQRKLFDDAGSMDELLHTAALRGQIARFLHKHKDDENGN